MVHIWDCPVRSVDGILSSVSPTNSLQRVSASPAFLNDYQHFWKYRSPDQAGDNGPGARAPINFLRFRSTQRNPAIRSQVSPPNPVLAWGNGGAGGNIDDDSPC